MLAASLFHSHEPDNGHLAVKPDMARELDAMESRSRHLGSRSSVMGRGGTSNAIRNVVELVEERYGSKPALAAFIEETVERVARGVSASHVRIDLGPVSSLSDRFSNGIIYAALLHEVEGRQQQSGSLQARLTMSGVSSEASLAAADVSAILRASPSPSAFALIVARVTAIDDGRNILEPGRDARQPDHPVAAPVDHERKTAATTVVRHDHGDRLGPRRKNEALPAAARMGAEGSRRQAAILSKGDLRQRQSESPGVVAVSSLRRIFGAGSRDWRRHPALGPAREYACGGSARCRGRFEVAEAAGGYKPAASPSHQPDVPSPPSNIAATGRQVVSPTAPSGASPAQSEPVLRVVTAASRQSPAVDMPGNAPIATDASSIKTAAEPLLRDQTAGVMTAVSSPQRRHDEGQLSAAVVSLARGRHEKPASKLPAAAALPDRPQSPSAPAPARESTESKPQVERPAPGKVSVVLAKMRANIDDAVRSVGAQFQTACAGCNGSKGCCTIDRRALADAKQNSKLTNPMPK